MNTREHAACGTTADAMGQTDPSSPPWEYDPDQEIPMHRGGGRLVPVLAIVAALCVGGLVGAMVRGAPSAPAASIADAGRMMGGADSDAAAPSTGPAPSAAAQTTVAGTVRAVVGTSVYVHRTGRPDQGVRVDAGSRVIVARRAGAASIRPGDAIRIVATPTPKGATAQRVVVGQRDLVQSLRP